MHDKRSEQGKRDPASDHQLPPVKVKPEMMKMQPAPATTNVRQQSNGAMAAAAGAKSASLRHSKSFNSKDSNMIYKAPKSHESTKVATNSEVGAAPLSTAAEEYIGSCNLPKSNGARKSEDHTLSKLRQSNIVKAEMVLQPAYCMGRSDQKVKSPGVLKNSSSCKVINELESQKKISKETSPAKPIHIHNIASRELGSRGVIPKVKAETSPKRALVTQVKSLSLSLNDDPQKKLPPIKTTRSTAASTKLLSAGSAKNLANLCAECRAELQGAVCFIGNDGRVSACTSRNAVRLCKNLKCANNNPEYVASMAAAVTAPKKYLVSRRHSINLPRSTLPNGKNGKPAVSDKAHAQTPTQINGSASEIGDLAAILPVQLQEEVYGSDDFDMKGELEVDDSTSPDDLNEEMVEIDGTASVSPHGGYQRVRRRSMSVSETQAPPEVVTLRKQMMQERKQAEEWMLDYAIEEALQKLGPSKDSKVKALVEAFESVIIPHKEVGEAVAQDHQRDRPKTPSKIAVRA